MRRTIAIPLMLAATAAGAGAQVPPDASWRTLASEHFRVTYMDGLQPLAEHAARRAEAAYAQLADALTRPPSGTIDIVLADNVDFTNGYATPFPSNRIVIYARPPVDVQGLDFYHDWIDLVVTHELAHIFHLDRAGRVGMALRSAFGRLPLLWPLFPAVGTPRWSIEGLATDIESDYTGMGRVNGTYHEMVVRTAVLEDRFDPLDRASATSPIWPGDERVYIYGSLFMDWLAERHGDDVRSRMIEKTASAIIPPILWFGPVGRRTLGESWGGAYRAWHDELRARYGRLADSLRAEGLTEPEAITAHGRYALHPRISPDGTRLAYAFQDGKSVSATRVLDLATGSEISRVRRNGIGPSSWFPGGDAYALAQFQYGDPYSIYLDLYTVERGREVRLTEGARLQDPDVDLDGERLVAVENGRGTNRLVVMRHSDRALNVLADFDPSVQWALPRWSPNGGRIAVGRWSRGGAYDVVVLDTLGNVLTELMRDRAVDGAPAWSPDGRYVVFASDRTGIPNLYAADLGARPVSIRQVTNVLGGAIYPDVSPDGRWIYFSDYHSDGYRIARIPFEPSSWRALPPLRPLIAASNGDGDAPSEVSPAQDALQLSASGRYSPFPSLLPKFWTPLLYEGGAGDAFYGAATAGVDLVGRHAFSAAVAYGPEESRWETSFSYDFAGLGNPVIELEAGRSWDDAIGVIFDDTIPRAGLQSEDEVALLATFVRRKWRSSAQLSLGVERIRVRRQVVDPPVPGTPHPDALDNLVGFIGRAGFANYRLPPYAISREDGISLAVAGRARFESDPHPQNGQSSNELLGVAAGYRSLALPGFAHHVLAVRASGLFREGDGAEPTRIAGASGGVYNALGLALAGESLLLPVRGFRRGARSGTKAWTASAEYRLPLALVGRRPKLSPLFLDRLSASLFVDAGDAWCEGLAAERFLACQPEFGGASEPRAPLIGAGGELVIDAALSAVAGGRIRLGIGFPLQGPGDDPIFYVRFGSAF